MVIVGGRPQVPVWLTVVHQFYARMITCQPMCLGDDIRDFNWAYYSPPAFILPFVEKETCILLLHLTHDYLPSVEWDFPAKPVHSTSVYTFSNIHKI